MNELCKKLTQLVLCTIFFLTVTSRKLKSQRKKNYLHRVSAERCHSPRNSQSHVHHGQSLRNDRDVIYFSLHRQGDTPNNISPVSLKSPALSDNYDDNDYQRIPLPEAREDNSQLLGPQYTGDRVSIYHISYLIFLHAIRRNRVYPTHEFLLNNVYFFA